MKKQIVLLCLRGLALFSLALGLSGCETKNGNPPACVAPPEVGRYGTLVGLRDAEGQEVFKDRPVTDGYAVVYEVKTAAGQWERKYFQAEGDQAITGTLLTPRTAGPEPNTTPGTAQSSKPSRAEVIATPTPRIIGDPIVKPTVSPIETSLKPKLLVANSTTKIVTTPDLMIVNSFYYDPLKKELRTARLFRNGTKANGQPERALRIISITSYSSLPKAKSAPKTTAGWFGLPTAFAAEPAGDFTNVSASSAVVTLPNLEDDSCWPCPRPPAPVCDAELGTGTTSQVRIVCLNCPAKNLIGRPVIITGLTQAQANQKYLELVQEGRCAAGGQGQGIFRLENGQYMLTCAICSGVPPENLYEIHQVESGRLEEALAALRCENPITQHLFNSDGSPIELSGARQVATVTRSGN